MSKVRVEVFKTKTCPHCSRAVALVTDVAKDIDGMEVEVVDAMKNPERAFRYKIMAVPTIVINGTVKFVGLPSRDVLVSNIKEELGRRG